MSAGAMMGASAFDKGLDQMNNYQNAWYGYRLSRQSRRHAYQDTVHDMRKAGINPIFAINKGANTTGSFGAGGGGGGSTAAAMVADKRARAEIKLLNEQTEGKRITNRIDSLRESITEFEKDMASNARDVSDGETKLFLTELPGLFKGSKFKGSSDFLQKWKAFWQMTGGGVQQTGNAARMFMRPKGLSIMNNINK